MDAPHARDFSLPPVLAIRGPSRSGKSTMVERLLPLLRERGITAAYLKHTHHDLDLPEKASGRIWTSEPGAMVLVAPDRLQVTLPAPGAATVEAMLAALPVEIDVALLETHSPQPYPTLLSTLLAPEAEEVVLARWAPLSGPGPAVMSALWAVLSGDQRVARALRLAARAHGGHACAGQVLGTRLALYAANLLDIALPDTEKRLVVRVETGRCAVDAIQAVTGCRPGRRTLSILDYGKLAATFIDTREGRAIRVAARPGLRERVGAEGPDRHALQTAAYLRLPANALFTVQAAPAVIDDYDLPGPPRRRVTCGACGEEVSDGREVIAGDGVRCRPCAATGDREMRGGRTWASAAAGF